MVSRAGPTTTSMASAWGLAAMWRRANSAWTGEISQLMILPPGASPAAMDRAEYPPKVPISSTVARPEGEGQHLEVTTLEAARPSSPGDSRVPRRSAARSSR